MTPSNERRLSSGSLSLPLSSCHDLFLIRETASEQTVTDLCRRALLQPMGLPELARCVVPGDQVVLVADPETPFLSQVLAAVWEHLQAVPDGGVALKLLLPEDPAGGNWRWIRESLPLPAREQMDIHVHNPCDKSQIAYIASSGSGERIYLNKLLADADLIINAGFIAFDRLLGFRGTSSSLFPVFSDARTIDQFRGQGHAELTPEQQRPFRDLIDEIGWLLGMQFVIQVIPGNSSMPAAILSGLPEAVMSRGKQIVNQFWRVSVDELLDGMVISIPGGQAFGWRQLGRALENILPLLRQGGRILVIADLPVPAGPAATMLRRCQDPEELLKPLRREPTTDSPEITQLIQSQRRARIYLFSGLDAEIVEEMGMIPVCDAAEASRLIASMNEYRIISDANFAWCAVAAGV